MTKQATRIEAHNLVGVFRRLGETIESQHAEIQRLIAEVERLASLVESAPNFFHPLYDFDGEKLEWLAKAGLIGAKEARNDG